jgi:hypothetical protein
MGKNKTFIKLEKKLRKVFNRPTKSEKNFNDKIKLKSNINSYIRKLELAAGKCKQKRADNDMKARNAIAKHNDTEAMLYSQSVIYFEKQTNTYNTYITKFNVIVDKIDEIQAISELEKHMKNINIYLNDSLKDKDAVGIITTLNTFEQKSSQTNIVSQIFDTSTNGLNQSKIDKEKITRYMSEIQAENNVNLNNTIDNTGIVQQTKDSSHKVPEKNFVY